MAADRPAGGARAIRGVLACAAAIVTLTACNRGPASDVRAQPGAPAAVTVTLATVEPTPTPTATPAPTPTPTPTPDPRALLEQAEKLGFDGYYEDAIAAHRRVLQFADPASDLAHLSRLSVARLSLNVGDTNGVIAFLSDPARSATLSPEELIVLGRAHALAGNPAAAVGPLQAALRAGSPISVQANVWLADAHLALNQPVSAVLPLSLAIAGSSNVNMVVGYREKLALARQLTGDFDAALAQYDAILGVARIPQYRARILWEAAKAFTAAGRAGDAFAKMRELMALHPDTQQAFEALDALIRAGQPVDELTRGIIDYENEQLAAAQQAFVRAIALPANQTPARLNEIRYWAGLNYTRLGDVAGALRNFNQIIAGGPSAPRYGDAQLAKADYLGATGDIEGALAAYAQLRAQAPGAAQSAQAAQRAARLLDRTDQTERAASAYLAAQRSYPAADGADEMLQRAAVALYRLGRYAEAVGAVAQLTTRYPNSAGAPAGLLWQSKANLRLGDVGATATLSALAQTRPESYEGARATELLRNANQPPLARDDAAIAAGLPGEACGLSLYNVFVCKPPDDGKIEAEAWLRAWLGISPTVDIGLVNAALRDDARFIQGNELWRLGFEAEARIELESLRAAYVRDPLAQYQLALHFRSLGLFRSSISAADALLRQSPARNTAGAPAFLARLVYPIYHTDLITRAAQEFAVDPLLVASLIRQESLFEAFAVSTAAAQGLMQVIPPTGREIAQQLGLAGQVTDRDLSRPHISARFGTYYLDRQRDAFGDWYTALAAYNGGPGNAARWKQRFRSSDGSSDPDVFAALIPFNETWRYVRAIAANHREYVRLYAR